MSLMDRATRYITAATAATDSCNSCKRPANFNGGIITQIIGSVDLCELNSASEIVIAQQVLPTPTP